MTHLTEAERQGAADGSLSEARRRRVAEHLAACGDCEADVARLRRLVALTRAAPAVAATAVPLDELWPEIRARIERDKVVPLVSATPAPPRRTSWTPRRAWAAGVAAALAVSAAGVVMMVRAARVATPLSDPVVVAPAGGDRSLVTNVGDSARAYEQEVQALLDEMALRRAMLRPDVAARMDHDVRVIDAAIAELQDALRHDPSNASLRALLAASYRQKRDLLKRAEDAS